MTLPLLAAARTLRRTRRLWVPTVGIGLLLACRGPVGGDRHLLTDGDRIAAITLTPTGDDQVLAHAYLVAGGQLHSERAVALRWAWLDPELPVEAQLEGPLDAVSAPAPQLDLPDPSGPNLLGLEATFPSGAVRRAFVEVDGTPALRPALDILSFSALPLALEASSPETLAAESRDSLEETPVDAPLPRDRWLRLTPEWPADDTGLTEAAPDRVRWMATGGTFLELDARRTDWAPAELVLDELALDSEITPLPEGEVITFVVLALDGAGGQQVLVTDQIVGAPPGDDLLRVGTRWIGIDPPPPSGTTHVAGLFVSEPSLPSGLALSSATPVPASSLPAENPYGTETLPCTQAVSGPFDPTWLFQGVCARGQVQGQRVVLELDP